MADHQGFPVIRQFLGPRSIPERRVTPAVPRPGRAFAFLADCGRVALTARGVFPLAGGLYTGGGFRAAEGWVTVEEPGRYLALFTLSGTMEGQERPAVFLVLGDGAAVGEPALLLRDGDGAAQGLGSAVAELRAGERIALAANGPLTLTGTPAVTLTLLRQI